MTLWGALELSLSLLSRPVDAVLPEDCQPLAVQVEVDEGEVGVQPMMVLGDASVAYLVEAEDSLQDTEDVLYFRSHF